MRTIIRRLVVMVACLLLGACGNFLDLRKELDEAEGYLGYLAGVVASPSCVDCPTILVVLGDVAGKTVYSYRIYERPGDFEMLTSGEGKYLFAFNDLNNDFEFQANEPCVSSPLPSVFAGGGRVEHIELFLTLGGNCSSDFGNLFEMRGATMGNIDVKLGKVVDLDDPRFSPRTATVGMWKPLSFMKEGHAGIFFLQPYVSEKIPVLFVHGINGSPREFMAMISRLDREKYQPWVFYYPSGLEIGALGNGMFGMLSELHHRHGFTQLHVIAHSMGGLVSRSYIAACAKTESCHYLRSFTSISSPFGGHEAAQSGIDFSPVVMPVWRSLAPGSPFLNELFKTPLPLDVPHYLLFGYRNASSAGKESGDGAVSLSSQLRSEAQQQASRQRGFDEDHKSILSADEVLDYIMDLLGQNESLESR